jgi:hypothetical protein
MLKQLSQFYYFYETDVVVKKDSDATASSDASDSASIAEID